MMAFKLWMARFAADERGAVTVDWVVLTAALVGLGIAIATTVGSGTMNAGDGLHECMRRAAIWAQRDDSRTDTHEKRLFRMKRGCENGMKAT